MLKTDNKDNPIINKIKALLGDVVLWYTVLIMTALMYHYRSNLALVYGVATLAIGIVLFRIFRYVAEHRFLGPLVYIVVLISFIFVARQCISIGSINYPIKFGLWFLTPQDALEYNAWFTLAIFFLFMIFMASVIYYFTRVRYRIFMNFLIFIIPFALYGKEYEKMPTIFIMLLAIGYIVIMINFRQLEADKKTVIIGKSSMWRSVAAYVVVFASIAAIVPKPEVTADRTFIEQMIAADALTDRFVEILAVFRDTTTNDNTRNNDDQRILYYAKGTEDLQLKLQTYSTYDYNKDSWSVTENDSKYWIKSTNGIITHERTGEILDVISYVAENDEKFALQYGLEEVDFSQLILPVNKTLRIQTITSRAQFAPVPTGFYSLSETSYVGELASTRSGSLGCTEGRFASYERFVYNYSNPHEFMMNTHNNALAKLMSRDDYYEILEYCADYLDNSNTRMEIVADNHVLWSSGFDAYLDYGDNEKIEALAREITEGLESDYDKALAIENYFHTNDFVYDLSYNKSSGENAEDFLFESKTGVCYEFASAMVLLSRAAGIPSRYCEGFSMSEHYENSNYDVNYVIKANAAHGFPELYIRGVGWVSFEPTISSILLENSDETATSKLTRAGILLFIAAILFLICVKLYPVVAHKLFLVVVKRREGSTAAIMIMHRICSLYKINSSYTSYEAAEIVRSVSGVDISHAAELFDRAAYGSSNITNEEKIKLTEIYIASYEGLRESKKKNSRKIIGAKS